MAAPLVGIALRAIVRGGASRSLRGRQGQVAVEFSPSVEEIQRRLRRRVESIVDLRKPNQQVAIVLDRWVQRNFKTEGGNVGGWTPFKRGGRRLPGGGIDTSAKLLQDTGALRLSYRLFWNSEIVGIGSDLDYSKPHEEGDGRLPQRRMLPQERDVIRPILKVYTNHVEKLTRKPLW